MRKPDDSSLTPEQYLRVRAHAERALRDSGALGCFPTPVAAIMQVAQVEEVHDEVLSETFVNKMRKKAGDKLKSALSKVLGLFDAVAGLVFIDRSLMKVKQTFIRLHEAGHGYMPWQRKLYAVVEDCKQSLEPDVADMFDREANVFASEVLFQLDSFAEAAGQEAFSIMTPVKLSSRYGASIYASVRQYVSKNPRVCVVLVLNKPELLAGAGFRCTLRRVVTSPGFDKIFGALPWAAAFTPNDEIGRMIPVAPRRLSGKYSLALRDRNGDRQECLAEAFTQGHQVFVLIHAVKALATSGFVMAPAADPGSGPKGRLSLA